ncbi:recombinase family protein [Brevundimonas vesicularis]|uniref:recombinase family protein n=1 Tax=Brevundimonas vesicularis TaxID=41276 RepID=UPI003908AAD4
MVIRTRPRSFVGVFADYADGNSPRTIAHALSAEGEPGPRGGDCTPCAIYDRRAGDGIPCQELYIGVRLLKRRRYRKPPNTGRRSAKRSPHRDLQADRPSRFLSPGRLWQVLPAGAWQLGRVARSE